MSWPPPSTKKPFKVGDVVELPDGRIGTVRYLPWDGRVAVETPWDASWTRYDPSDLKKLEAS